MIIYYITYFLLALAILKGIYNWIHAIILRAAMYIKLSKICKKRGFAFEKPRSFFASFFRFSPKPDIIIRTADADFIVRIVTCRARKRVYHFVNHEWFVRVVNVFLLLPFMSGDRLTLHRHVGHIPPLDGKYLSDRARVVLLFNPSPLSATFTTNQNRHELASNGADFDGWVTYNAKALAEALGDSC